MSFNLFIRSSYKGTYYSSYNKAKTCNNMIKPKDVVPYDGILITTTVSYSLCKC